MFGRRSARLSHSRTAGSEGRALHASAIALIRRSACRFPYFGPMNRSSFVGTEWCSWTMTHLPPVLRSPVHTGLRLNLRCGKPLTDPMVPDLWRRELARAATHISLGYPPMQGLIKLQQAVANYLYERRGIVADPVDIAIMMARSKRSRWPTPIAGDRRGVVIVAAPNGGQGHPAGIRPEREPSVRRRSGRASPRPACRSRGRVCRQACVSCLQPQLWLRGS